MKDNMERPRFFSQAKAKEIIALQLQLMPDVLDEYKKLADGKIGLIQAIMDKVSNEVSFEPDVEITPISFRMLAGAPADDTQLPGWRETFWDEYKKNQPK